jgi:hypothetical protein
MGFVTEWNADHMVPRLNIMDKESDLSDGYAHGQELTVGLDGYVVQLRANTVYAIQARSQALYYGVITERDINRMQVGDDSEKLAMLNTGGSVNGHYLPTGTIVKFRTTPRCRVLVMKSAASTATVNLNPLGGIVDPPDFGGR